MAGCISILQVDRPTCRQSLKGAMILIILTNIVLFALFLISEYRTLIEFNYSISLFKWFQFSISFLLAIVSIHAIRAVTDHQPFVLLIFTKSNVILIFLSSVILIFLRFFQSQVLEYLAQQDLRTPCSNRPPKSLAERNLETIIFQELVRMGWELMSFLVAINYYRSMLQKRTHSIIYTIPQQFLVWEDETTNNKLKSISASINQSKTPPYARLF